MTILDELETPAAAPKKRKKWPWIVAFSVVGVLIAGAVVGGVYVAGLSSSFNQAEKLPSAEVFPDPTTRPEPATPDAVNILLLGSDTRDKVDDDIENISGQRADSILLVHIPGDRSGAQVISFMRDNWVEIPGHGEHKLNAALAFGGVPLLVETLENIIDVPIDHVAITDFNGFTDLTDALGGVTVSNHIPFSAGGHTFEPGDITLDGDAALWFVHERYSFPDGDYQRVRNQQAFLRGVFDKLLSKETLTDPGRIAEVVDALSPYLTVDDGLNIGYIAPLAISLRDLRKDDVEFLTAPTLGTGMVGDQSIVKPDWDGLEDLAEALKNDTVPEYVASHK